MELKISMAVSYSINQSTQNGLKYLSEVLTDLNVDINPILKRIRETSNKDERKKIIDAIAMEALRIKSKNLPTEELREVLRKGLILTMDLVTLMFINIFYTEKILSMAEGDITKLRISKEVISKSREITTEILKFKPI